jgi:hypothetical protein
MPVYAAAIVGAANAAKIAAAHPARHFRVAPNVETAVVITTPSAGNFATARKRRPCQPFDHARWASSDWQTRSPTSLAVSPQRSRRITNRRTARIQSSRSAPKQSALGPSTVHSQRPRDRDDLRVERPTQAGRVLDAKDVPSVSVRHRLHELKTSRRCVRWSRPATQERLER